MKLILATDAVDDFCDAIIGLVNGHKANAELGIPKTRGLRTELKELLDRYKVERPDSLPGGNEPGASVTEDDGAALPHSDPVFGAVIKRQYGGPVEDALHAGAQALIAAQRALATAESSAMQAKPPIEVPPNTDDVWCISHLRFNMTEPRGARDGQLCGWCAKFRSAEGQLPTFGILDRRSRGLNIDAEFIDQELGQKGEQRRSKKKSKKRR